jgi:DNA polymerase-1
MANTDKPLILVDGSSWLYRAFHALPPLSSPRGEPTGAIYGMGNMMRRLLKDYAPEHIGVIFDPRGKTFRHDIYADYKANRPPVPEELSSQFPPLRRLLETMGLPVLQIDGVEADDVIATLSRAAERDGKTVLIVSGDKDLAQLVGPGVKLLDTMKQSTLDADGVREKYGVTPEQIVDWLTLMGDTSDNIPGIDGVGPKTAAKWLEQYGTLDALMAAADEIKGKAGERLRGALEMLPRSRELATVRDDVELPAEWHEWQALTPSAADSAALAEMYRELGFTRWLDDLDATSSAAAPGQDASPAEGARAQNEISTEVTTVLDAEALEALRKALEAAELICIDTETDSLDSHSARLVGMSFAVAPGKAWYLPLAHTGMDVPEQLPFETVRDALAPLLADPARPKLGQNLKYDINVLANAGMPLRGIAHDTMLQSYALDANARHDMDTLAEMHLGHRTIKFSEVAGKGRKQLTFDQVDIPRAAEYAGEDADITLRLHQALWPRLQQTDGQLEVYETLEIPLVPILADIERNGVRVDADRLAAISKEFGERMNELQAQAWEAAGSQFNLASPPQLQQILFEQLKLPVVARTPKGQPSTNEEVLEQLVGEHALPAIILEWRGMAKLRGTYTDALPKQINPRTGRIHTSYHQAVAATGRLSSSDPNLQNIPIRNDAGRRIREAFVAADGEALLAIDYSQIELRLMAHFSGDERLTKAFIDKLDVHRATAAEIFDLQPDAVTADHRRAAKAINFGLIYGMSAFGLARNLGIPRGQAAEYIERFFARYPGVRQYMEGTREKARENGYVETLWGRRLYLPNIKARNPNLRQYAERTAINAPLQGTAADLIKRAMIDLHGWLAAEAPEVRIIMQVHDELVFEGPEKRLRELRETLSTRMCEVAELAVPLVAEGGIGDNWNAAHE